MFAIRYFYGITTMVRDATTEKATKILEDAWHTHEKKESLENVR